MKTSGSFAPLLLASALAAAAQDVVVQSFDTGGTLVFNEVSNAVAYRVEWASAPGGEWTNFAAASARLDNIPPAGGSRVTSSVPLWYRVVASVMDPPPAGMVAIPARSFIMGACTNVGQESNPDEVPQHSVYVSAFYLDKYEVTKALWDTVRVWSTNHGYAYQWAGNAKDTNYPVHQINWYDTVKWCNARSEKEGLTPVYYTNAGFTVVYRTGQLVEPYVNWAANGYRLPTEAEWEKAARGRWMNHRFPWDDQETIQHARANYLSTNLYAYDTSPTRGLHPAWTNGGEPCTSVVGSFAPNSYGVYDMAGNVWEWCWDWWAADYYANSPATDPRGGTIASGSRVLRGGAWGADAFYSRAAERSYNNPSGMSYLWGFRCARGLGP